MYKYNPFVNFSDYEKANPIKPWEPIYKKPTNLYKIMVRRYIKKPYSRQYYMFFIGK